MKLAGALTGLSLPVPIRDLSHKISHAWGSRPVVWSLPIPGFDNSQDLSQLSWTDDQGYKGLVHKTGSSRNAQLEAQLPGIGRRIVSQPPSEFRRPATSKVRAMLTAGLPMLKPRSTSDVLTMDDAPRSDKPQASNVPASAIRLAREQLSAARQQAALADAADLAAGEASRALESLRQRGTGTAAELQAAQAIHALAEKNAMAKRTKLGELEIGLSDANAKALEQMMAEPPGFAGERAAGALKTAMLEFWGLHVRTGTAIEALPGAGMAEMILLGLAKVTSGDADRAAAALSLLLRHDPLDWICACDGMGLPESARQDVQALFRTMSGVTRGIEVLMVAAHGGASSIAQTGEKALILRAYWKADTAQQEAADEESVAWLEGAKRAATMLLRGAGADTTVPAKELAALRAVRNGYTSIAPGSDYDQANCRLRKAIAEWVDRAGGHPQRGGVGISPLQGKSPFRGTLKAANSAGKAFGHSTPSAAAESAVRRCVEALQEQVDGKLKASSSEPPAQLLATAGLLRAMGARTDRSLAKGRLDGRDLLVAVQFLDSEIAGVPPGRRAALRDEVKRELEAHARKAPCLATLQRIAGEGEDRDIRESIDQAARLAAISGGSSLGSKQDLLDFMEPLLDDWRLRDRLRFGGGGNLGATTAGLSFVAGIAGVAPSASANVRHDAFIDLYHPMRTLQLTLGSRRQVSGSAAISVGPNISLLDDGLKLGIRGGLMLGEASDAVEGVTLRVRHQRGERRDMRGEMKQIVRDLVQWDALRDEKGSTYDDPLQAMLARNPTLNVSHVHQKNSTTMGELRADVGLRVPVLRRDNDRGGLLADDVGPLASVALSVERAKQSQGERKGEVTWPVQHGSLAQQRLRIGAGLSDRFSGADSDVSCGIQPLLNVSRELWQNHEKVALTVFNFAGTLDVDLDRFYDTPKEMLHDLDANRERWILRCMETLDLTDVAPQQRQTVGRDRASDLLEHFRADVAEIARKSKYAVFNLQYGLRPDAAPHLEMMCALLELAELRGDQAAAQQLREERDLLLNDSSIWRPCAMNVLERGRHHRNRIFSFGLRVGKTYFAEAQRQLTEYPPR